MKTAPAIPKLALQVFRVLFTLVLVGYIILWTLNPGEEYHFILNTAMFILIGMAYLAYAWALDRIKHKLTVLICALYLMVMNFLDFSQNTLIGIFCIIIPLAIAYYLPDDEKTSVEKI